MQPSDSKENSSGQVGNVARQSARSSYFLTIANFTETFFLAIASFIIARLLGPGNFGLFNLALAIPIFLSSFVDLGAMYSIQRDAAFYLSREDVDTARRKTKNAIVFILIQGVTLSVVCFFGSRIFASAFLHRPALTFEIEIGSMLVLAQALLTALTVGFLGWKSTGLAGGINIIQAILKVVLAPVLIILGFGVLGAVAGHVFSYVFACVFALAAFYIVIFKRHKPPVVRQVSENSSLAVESSTINTTGATPAKTGFASGINFLKVNSFRESLSLFKTDLKQMIGLGLASYFGTLLGSISLGTFILLILAAFVPNSIIGYYQAALNITQGISLISTALGYSLFTAFSSLAGLNADVRSAFRESSKYVSLIMMPSTLFLIAASNPAVLTLYGPQYAQAGTVLAYLALYYLPLAILGPTFGALFGGMGKTKLTLLVRIAGASVIFALVPILEILGQGLTGVIYALILSNIVTVILSTFLAKRYMNASIDFRSTARIFFASDIAFITTYLTQYVIHTSHVITLMLDILIFFVVYLSMIPVLRTIELEDLERLKDSIGGIGVMKKPLELILRYEIYLMKKTNPR